MYPNYTEDRKALGYECLIDTQCGNRLVLTTDSSVRFVKNFTLDRKREIFVIIAVIIIIFSDVKSAEAIGTSLPPKQRIVSIMPDQDASRLIKPSKVSINSNIEPKIIIMPSLSESIRSVRTKSDLQNSQWLEEFVSTIRGGDNEKLIKSIISKVSETNGDITSINKILKKLAEVTVEIGTNDKLVRILAELEKPISQPSIFVEGLTNPLPRHRKRYEVKKNKYSSPSREFLLDSTKCYGHQEAYNMPRHVGDGSILTDLQVRKKFKHAPDFGVLGNPNRKNYELFKDRLIEHMNNPSTRIKEGTYKKNIEVLHYFNKKTGLNVMIRQDNNTFLSGWELNDKQLENVKNKGAL